MKPALACVLLLLAGSATADNKKAPPKSPEARPAPGPKVKKYDFGGLDVEGRLKTPQLLYFLNRMKSELDTTAPEKRSFLPELKHTAEEM